LKYLGKSRQVLVAGDNGSDLPQEFAPPIEGQFPYQPLNRQLKRWRCEPSNIAFKRFFNTTLD
jgi:hypothetical protein